MKASQPRKIDAYLRVSRVGERAGSDSYGSPDDQRQAIAWYAWCIDEASGMLYRDSMIARAHYMITEFSDFDGDITVTPPEGAEPPPEGSQTALEVPFWMR